MRDDRLDRRHFLQKSIAMAAGTAAALSLEEEILLAQTSEGPNAPSSGGVQLPRGKIGRVELSRLICGGNLIGGWAHSGDLVYVSSLMQHYFTDEKIIETLEICEKNGIDAVVTVVDQRTMDVLAKHRANGGKIQWIAQLRAESGDHLQEAKVACEQGAAGGFLHGGTADSWVQDTGSVEKIGDIASLLKKNGLIAGVGGHNLKTIMACDKAGLDLDFYFKTLNTVKYASEAPEETVEFMKTVKKPWIAYKVLGAGRISPTEGFKHALHSGADFMCVGMFDFQVADDVVIAKGLFARGIERERPWCG